MILRHWYNIILDGYKYFHETPHNYKMMTRIRRDDGQVTTDYIDVHLVYIKPESSSISAPRVPDTEIYKSLNMNNFPRLLPKTMIVSFACMRHTRWITL